jgi:uncharacterized protein CbrC (UPF0167 family)
VALPQFKYHPDPLDTGMVVLSDAECVCCETSRAYIYKGPVFAEEEYVDCICPWCIADGSAHEKLDADFHDQQGVPGWACLGACEVDQTIVAEVCFRTPGFCGWQQEQWHTCCNDAAAFLGPAGHRELTSRWAEAIDAIRDTTGLEGQQWEQFLKSLDRDHGPTAYIFRCLHCGKYGGYQDCD